MIRKAIRSVVRNLGYDFVRYDKDRQYGFPDDFERRHIEIIEKVTPYTTTSHERIHALIESVRHVLRNDIKGSLLECGVYRGGSMMAVALALIAAGGTKKKKYIFFLFFVGRLPRGRSIE